GPHRRGYAPNERPVRARASPSTNRLPTAQRNPGSAGRTRLPGWFRHGGAEGISLRADHVAPRNGHAGGWDGHAGGWDGHAGGWDDHAGGWDGRSAPGAAGCGSVAGRWSLAADISGFGVVYGPGATRPVPIASVAKVMTAYVVLHDHP